jgi:hypothetical protein
MSYEVKIYKIESRIHLKKGHYFSDTGFFQPEHF